jgi:hypothetical protein
VTRGRALAASWRPEVAAGRASSRRPSASWSVPLWAATLAAVAASVTQASPATGQTRQSVRTAAQLESAAATARGTSSVSIAVSTLYGVSVPTGSWVPVVLSVANRGTSDLQGQIVLNSADHGPFPTALASSIGGCFANGPSTFTCLGSGDFASGPLPVPPRRGDPRPSSPKTRVPLPSLGPVTYRIPLDLAAATTKELVVDLLAEPESQEVGAAVEGPSGTVLVRAATELPLAYGTTPAAVLVVTGNEGNASTLGHLVSPTGSRPQLQYSSAADLPIWPGPLGVFRAVAIDGADTTGLSPAQGESLQGYVEAGGTLVVFGGLSWRATTAGLPANLLPGRPTGGVASLGLPGLCRLLSTKVLREPVDVAAVREAPGAAVTLSQGKTPIALQVSLGSGHAVFSAVDPAVPPLAGWPGITALLSRLFAPAFGPGYFASPLPYAEAGGLYPAPPGDLPPAALARLGTDATTRPALTSPGPAENALAGYLEQAPIERPPPSATFVGLLLLGYVLLAGPVCFMVLTRLRRRQLAWVLVPGLAVAATLVAVEASPRGSPTVQEVNVAQVAPGAHLAQVTTLDVAPLSGGGTRRFELVEAASAALALPAEVTPGAVGRLVVAPERAPSAVKVAVGGQRGSSGGWAEAEQVHLAGTLRTAVAAYGNVVGGRVTNDLGLELTDAQVAVASGEATELLGSVEPGHTVAFTLSLSPNASPPVQAFGAPAELVPEIVPSVKAPPGLGSGEPGASTRPARTGPAPSSALRASGLLQALNDLASSFSAQHGGDPVFVALAGGTLLAHKTLSGTPVADYEVVVAPLTMTFSDGIRPGPVPFDVPAELVGSAGVTGENSYALTTGSLTLGLGGRFDYQFLLPGARWAHLDLDLGTSAGSTPGHPLVRVTAYNYSTSGWDQLLVRARAGELLAGITHPARYMGPGDALEVRIAALQDGVEVYGAYPTLWATPSAGAQ